MNLAGGNVSTLMHADSAFAAGSVSFSNGLEAWAQIRGELTDDDVAEYVGGVVERRWATFDRVFLNRAWNAWPDVDRLAAIDEDIEVHTLGAAARAASRRAGTALLGMWARQGMSGAQKVRSALPWGHSQVCQAAVWQLSNLTLPAAESLSVWAVIAQSMSAGVRLGLLGHLSAQRLMTQLAKLADEIVSEPLRSDAQPWTWTPVQDISIERHTFSDMKVFVS